MTNAWDLMDHGEPLWTMTLGLGCERLNGMLESNGLVVSAHLKNISEWVQSSRVQYTRKYIKVESKRIYIKPPYTPPKMVRFPHSLSFPDKVFRSSADSVPCCIVPTWVS